MQFANDRRGVTGKSLSLRRDEHYFARPTAHAGLGELRVVIGNDIFDAEFATETVLRLFEKFNGARDLFARGQKLFAVDESPAVILHVRKFNA